MPRSSIPPAFGESGDGIHENCEISDDTEATADASAILFAWIWNAPRAPAALANCASRGRYSGLQAVGVRLRPRLTDSRQEASTKAGAAPYKGRIM